MTLRFDVGGKEHVYGFNSLMGTLEFTVLGFLFKNGFDPNRVDFEICLDPSK